MNSPIKRENLPEKITTKDLLKTTGESIKIKGKKPSQKQMQEIKKSFADTNLKDKFNKLSYSHLNKSQIKKFLEQFPHDFTSAEKRKIVEKLKKESQTSQSQASKEHARDQGFLKRVNAALGGSRPAIQSQKSGSSPIQPDSSLPSLTPPASPPTSSQKINLSHSKLPPNVIKSPTDSD